jgi:hypothetical protein
LVNNNAATSGEAENARRAIRASWWNKRLRGKKWRGVEGRGKATYLLGK